MKDLIKIAVDAMGGDGSPKKIIDGIIHNHKSKKENYFKIFGDENEIKKHLNDQIEKKFLSTLPFKISNIFFSSPKILKKLFLLDLWL